MCVYSCLRYPACKWLIFCPVLQSSVACLTLLYFFTFSHNKWHHLWGQITDHRTRFDFLYNFSVIFLILRRIQRDTNTNLRMSPHKVSGILLMKPKLRFSNHHQISNFMKSCSMWTNEQTWHSRTVLCNFANAILSLYLPQILLNHHYTSSDRHTDCLVLSHKHSL